MLEYLEMNELTRLPRQEQLSLQTQTVVYHQQTSSVSFARASELVGSRIGMLSQLPISFVL